MEPKKILVTVMNWGLGHAARCIPVIRQLEQQGYIPLLASDGPALLLLRKEFPDLRSFELPSYDIQYSRHAGLMKWKLLKQTPHILRTIQEEKRMTEELVTREGIAGIISDNRFGTRSPLVKNAYITHQLRVLSGNSTWLSSRIHQHYIKKFDECWIPDAPGSRNLSGMLGHPAGNSSEIKYMGPISRFKRKALPKEYDYLILLSGPEPQRNLLEKILLRAFKHSEKRILLVRGVVTEVPPQNLHPTLEIRNYLYGEELELAINSSELVISRPGYTTILDLAKLEKKAFFIPTPGQYEQEYLARRLMEKKIAPFAKQKDFRISLLERLEAYSGLTNLGFTPCIGDLFALFESE